MNELYEEHVKNNTIFKKKTKQKHLLEHVKK